MSKDKKPTRGGSFLVDKDGNRTQTRKPTQLPGKAKAEKQGSKADSKSETPKAGNDKKVK